MTVVRECTQPTVAAVQSFPPSFDEWVAEDFIVVDNIESLTIPNKSKPKATAAHTGKADFSNPEVC